MKIATKYLSVIETDKYKASYNVTSATKTLGKQTKEDGLVLHSVEFYGEVPKNHDFKVMILDAYSYRVSWTGKPATEIKLIVSLTSKKNTLIETDSEFNQLEIKNSVTIEPRTIVRMVENGELFLEPEYQRGFVWTQEHKEEFLLDWINGKVIVTPYLVSYYQDDKHIYEVLDGKQRLQTVYEFLSNKITVNNLFYKDLLEYEKMAILHKQITGLLLTQTSGDNAYTRPDLKILAQTFLNFNKGITVDEEILNQAKTFIK